MAVADLDDFMDPQQPVPVDLRFGRMWYAIRCAFGDFPWSHIASGEGGSTFLTLLTLRESLSQSLSRPSHSTLLDPVLPGSLCPDSLALLPP